MQPIQAVQLLAQATGLLKLTRDEHNQVALALTTLQALATKDDNETRTHAPQPVGTADEPTTNGDGSRHELVAAMPGRRSKRHR